MEALRIEGSWSFTPTLHADDRGLLGEWFRRADFTEGTGQQLSLAQANVSVSRQGVIRGIHFAEVPPGQAKYVTCARGAVLDVVVDIRPGSPTFGEWEAVRLDDTDRRAVYISEGLGHAFCALTDDATVMYACSQPYTPDREHAINPLDPDIGIGWPSDAQLVLSEKDTAAPGLSEAERLGWLSTYDDCVRYRASLRG